MADNLGVEFDLQDIEADDATAAALVEKGGKRQVPFLVDTDRDVALYESADIIDYIREHYANTAAAKPAPRVHNAGEGATCIACEG